ncbi:unnamed protein product, partial [Schistosoma mattheei]
ISDTKNHCLIKFPKAFGRTLSPEQVYSIGIKSFLGADPTYCVKLAQNYIIQLGRILNWYVEYGARELTFCRSSILLIHESLPSNNYNNNEHCPSKSCFASSSAPTTTVIKNNNNTHHTSCTTRNPTVKTSTILNNQFVNNFNNIPSIHEINTNNGNNNDTPNITATTTSTSTVHAQVYLIDFAHWSKKNYSTQCNNNNNNIEYNKNYWTCELTNGFRYGLENLIQLMHCVVNKESAICIN